MQLSRILITTTTPHPPVASPPLSCRHEVDIYEGRQWVGGKVASFTDKDGNHIEVRAGGWGRVEGGRLGCM